MKWNSLLLPLYEQPAPAPRRWWVGWLQLLCAWVLCMLLCANIALVLAKDLPERSGKAAGGKTVAAMATWPAAQPAADGDAHVDPGKGRAGARKAPGARIFAL